MNKRYIIRSHQKILKTHSHLKSNKNTLEIFCYDWLVGCTVKANCPHVGSGLTGRVSSVRGGGVCLRDVSKYLREFQRKPLKAANGSIVNPDQGSNLAPPVYQF